MSMKKLCPGDSAFYAGVQNYTQKLLKSLNALIQERLNLSCPPLQTKHRQVPALVVDQDKRGKALPFGWFVGEHQTTTTSSKQVTHRTIRAQ